MEEIWRKYRMETVIGLALLIIILIIYFQMKGYSMAKHDELVLFYAIEDYLFHNGPADFWFNHPPYSAYWAPVPVALMVLVIKVAHANGAIIYFYTLGIHFLCVLVLFAVLRTVTRNLWCSAFAAALFATHPLNVELVASLQHSVHTVSALLYLIALAIYAAGWPHPTPRQYLSIFVVWIASLLSHPSAIHLPALLLVMDFWMKESKSPTSVGTEAASSSPRLRSLAIAKLTFFGFALLWVGLSLGFVFFLQPQKPTADLSASLTRLPLSFICWVRYLQAVFQPFVLPTEGEGASLFSPPYPWAQIGLSFLLLAAISLTVIWLAKKYRSLAAGWLWFLIWLTPFIALHLSKENIIDRRYAYLAPVGIYIMISWGGAALVSRLPHKKIIAPMLMAAVLISLTVSARQQVRHWKDVDAYIDFSSAGLSPVAKSRIYFNYGRLFLFQGELDKATGKLRQALWLNDCSPEIHNNLGLALAAKGKNQAAINHFTRALDLRPDYLEAQNNLANLLADTGRLQEAVTHYQKALQLEPRQYTIHNNLASVLMLRGEREPALRHLKKALAINPDYQTARQNLQRLEAAMDLPPSAGRRP